MGGTGNAHGFRVVEHRRNGVDDDSTVIVVSHLLRAFYALCDKLCRLQRRKGDSTQIQEAEVSGAGGEPALVGQQVQAVQEHGLGKFEVDEQHVAHGGGVSEPFLTVAKRKSQVHQGHRLSAFRGSGE